jgi:hypothetical protein
MKSMSYCGFRQKKKMFPIQGNVKERALLVGMKTHITPGG